MAFKVLCRCCLSTESEKRLVSLPSLVLNSFCSSIPTNNVHFGSALCWMCYALFKKCILFKELCVQSDKLLGTYTEKNCDEDYQNQKDEAMNLLPKLNYTKINNVTYFYDETSAQNSRLDELQNVNGKSCNENKINNESEQSNDGQDNNLPVNEIANKLKKCKEKMRKKVEDFRNRKKGLYSRECAKKKELLDILNVKLDTSMVKITVLSKEQQFQDIKNQRSSKEYVESPYKCNSCAKGFVHETVYNRHQKKHDLMSGEHICELCNQHFKTKKNLNTHLDTHSYRYECRICGKIVISKQNIKSHIYTEHDESNKEIKCSICNKVYKNKFTYTKHMRIHTSSKEYKCYICQKGFLWKNNLNRHLTRHKSEKPFKCELCSKSFFLKENLKDHESIHLEGKRFYCVECDLSYTTQAKLNQHLNRGTRHLKPEQFTFACKYCDKRYTNSLQLSMHMDRTHLHKRSHVCHSCSAAFVSKKTLQTHIKSVHEGYKKPKNQICETCGKGFSSKQILQAHLRTHTGEKPYTCRHCGVNFAHSGAMYTHIKLVHLKIKKNAVISKESCDKIGFNKTNHINVAEDSSVVKKVSNSISLVEENSDFASNTLSNKVK